MNIEQFYMDRFTTQQTANLTKMKTEIAKLKDSLQWFSCQPHCTWLCHGLSRSIEEAETAYSQTFRQSVNTYITANRVIVRKSKG